MKKALISIGCFCCFFFIIGIYCIYVTFGVEQQTLKFSYLNDVMQKDILTALDLNFASNESIISISHLRHKNQNHDVGYKIEIQTNNINVFLDNNSFLTKFFQKTEKKRDDTGYYYNGNYLYILIQTRDYDVWEKNDTNKYLFNLNNALEKVFYNI